jgi:hypothetical protein
MVGKVVWQTVNRIQKLPLLSAFIERQSIEYNRPVALLIQHR